MTYAFNINRLYYCLLIVSFICLLPLANKSFAIDEFTIDADNNGTFDADELASSPFDWGGVTNGTGAAGEVTNSSDVQINATGTIIVTDTDDIGDGNALVDAISFAANSLTLFIDDSINDDSAESITISGDIGLNAVAQANIIITGENTDINPDTLSVDINGNVDLGTGALTITADNLNAGNDVNVFISGDLTAASTTLNAAASAATLTFDGGGAQTINGTVNGGSSGEGVIEISGAGTSVASTGVWGGVSNLDEINVISGATFTTGDAITANSITIGASSTLNTGGDVTGNLNFTGAGATLALGDNLGISGTVDNLSGGDGVGIITSASTAGNTSSLSGAVGDTNSLNQIELLGDGQITFVGSVNAQTIIASAANGTLDFNDNIIGNIELQADATIDMAAGVALTGAIDNTSGADGSGEILLDTTGDSNSVSGTIGNTNSLRLLTLSGDGEVNFSSNVNIDDIVFAADTEVTFADVTTLNGIDFANFNGNLSFSDGSVLTGDIFSTGGENGTVIFDGTTSVVGQLGTSAATGIASVNVNAIGNVVSISEDSFIGTLQVLSDSTLDIDSNLTASTSISNNGVISVDETSILTSPSFDGSGSYLIPVTDDGDGILNAADFATFSSTGAIDLSDESIDIVFSGTPVIGTATIGSGGAAALSPLAVRDNSFILVADINANGNDLELSVRTDSANASSTVNGKNVGEVIDSLIGSTNPQLSAIIDNVLAVTNTGDLDALLESTVSTVDAGALMASISVANQMYSLTRLRLSSLNSSRTPYMTGMSSGSNPYTKVNYWLQSFGSSYDQDKRGNVEGYEASTYGVAAGMDTKDHNSDLAVGAAIGIGSTEVDSNNSNNTDTDINSYQIVLYGEHKIGTKTSFSGQLGYIWGDVETERQNVGNIQGLNAKGEYNTHQFQAKAKLSREYLVINSKQRLNYQESISWVFLQFFRLISVQTILILMQKVILKAELGALIFMLSKTI
jgi:uncharacterized protein with beta-barrel porin domain